MVEADLRLHFAVRMSESIRVGTWQLHYWRFSSIMHFHARKCISSQNKEIACNVES